MPEGPEIRRAADEIAKVLVGRKVMEAELLMPSLRMFEGKVVGQTVTAIDTRGKAMLTRFGNGLVMYSHNQLYGRWFAVSRGEHPRTNRQLRVALHTRTHSALLYSASDIEIFDESEESEHPFLKRAGPDILDASLTADTVAERLTANGFRNRALGNLYLDQGFLAGNGNYLRSEILWAARLNPLSRPGNVPKDALKRLARETLAIARRSYRTRGVTVPEKIARERRATGMSFEQYRFQVYGRDGQPCYRCDTTIDRFNSGSRSVFICPACQSR
ncbi:MAG: endonuclease VIII [Woeseiaceae bacterium]|nr:endonuclease VIII [Woeseiaceae bacterium]